MHVFQVAATFLVLLMVGSEFAVAAFMDPSAWRLDPGPQSVLLSHFATVLGKIMPFWYGVSLLVIATEAWLFRHTPVFSILLAAAVLWFLATLGSILFLVPLNNCVIEASRGWQAAHRSWDRRHRVRVAVLAVAALLFTYAMVR